MSGQNNHDSNAESYWNFKGHFDFVDQWFLMGSPIPIIVILTAYLAFVLKLGPDFMKKRKAYKLTNILLVYNLAEIIFAAYLFNLCIKILVPLGMLRKTCTMDTEESKYQVTSTNYWYFICKLTELLDTVFFVLRKKRNQISFLHVYHHTLLGLCSWLFLKYEPGYTLLFIGTLNSFVHIIMYTYYALSAFPGMAKYLWWKKYITILQLTQFILVLIEFVANIVISKCKPSTVMTVLILPNLALFIHLFLKFYMKTYTDAQSKQETKAKNVYITNVSGDFNGETVKGRSKNTDNMKKKTYYNDTNQANKRYIYKHRPIGEGFQTR
ncbi:elongation of very long chain fatty acids protein 7 [Manduca sexta]|uniref:elongation of very long chain fatty acids protein 7 n=1 Tax=Manduca sexta TaxID=7130 RepID=UPI00188F27D0|nr:elongation of very long chain fatty acids protein 7 [Manduca sexta]